LIDLPMTPALLRVAYSQGLFPMPEPQTEQVLWFSPDPRAIIPLDGFHTSRSLRRTLNKKKFRISFNEDFTGVMLACGDRKDTWINAEFLDVYSQLHREGGAHSVEVWQEGKLVGGTYGVALGGAFFAESKFHRVTDASKVAIYHLVKHLNERGFKLLEVQFLTPHLKTLGAVEISRPDYMKRLAAALKVKTSF
jgi:leucyl/phenylalanyl-tRNA--protein transferase